MDSKFFILVLSNLNCPLEHVFNLIDELYAGNVCHLTDMNGTLNNTGKNVLKNLINNYQNPINIQTLNNEVNDIKVELKNSVNNIISNTEDAKDLEMKASRINENSRQLLNDSQSLRKNTSCCQRWKWCLVFIIIILIVGLIIVPKFVLDSPKNPIWDYFDTNKTNSNNTIVDDQNRI